MNQFPDHGIHDPDIGTGGQPCLPTAEALLAGTLALMTGYAQAFRQQHRTLMTEKIIANLAMLCSHSEASAGLRNMTANLHAMWHRLLLASEPLPGAMQSDDSAGRSLQNDRLHSVSEPNRVLWHLTPEAVQ